MEILHREKTKHSPEIDFNPQTGVLKVIGRSLMENYRAFYQPIFDWLDEYLLNPHPETLMIFQLSYYNTAQSMNIATLFRKLLVLSNQGNKVSVKWYYDEHDEDMEENGKDYQSLFNLDMELIVMPH